MRFAVALLLFVAASKSLYALEEQAPEFERIAEWINSPPLKMQDLRGHVLLIDFWDYSCINCIRTFPHLNSWYSTYKDKGFVIIGVHTPEFHFSHDKENVLKAVKRYGIYYPVAMDNDYATWKAYKNRYWPTSYLVDKEGKIRSKHIGEGSYHEIENEIRKLLGLEPLEKKESEPARVALTPEIYLGSRRAQNYSSEIDLIPDAVVAYSIKEPPAVDRVALKGLWRVGPYSITSAGSGCQIALHFVASKVHAVLSGASSTPITVRLDGKPVSTSNYSLDMDSDGQIFVDSDRMYDLIDLHGEVKHHQLIINVPPGISFYTFTFSAK